MPEVGAVLLQGCQEVGLAISEQQIKAFQQYAQLLLTWNEKINLTAIKDAEGIAIKHFVDSLLCSKYLPVQDNLKLIDIGTGAGFPGLPLKIYQTQLQVTLLDSLNKRVNFLNEVVNNLQLQAVTNVHGRAEEFAHKNGYRAGFDIVVSRAVAKLAVLAEYCLPFVKVGGIFIAMKGSNTVAEVEEGKFAVQELGGKLQEVIEYQLPLLGDGRSLVILKKVAATPGKYPRKAGLPEKKPLVKE